MLTINMLKISLNFYAKRTFFSVKLQLLSGYMFSNIQVSVSLIFRSFDNDKRISYIFITLSQKIY